MEERKCSIWRRRKPFRQQENSMEGKKMRKEEVKGKEGVEGVTKEVNVMKKTFVKKNLKVLLRDAHQSARVPRTTMSWPYSAEVL